MDLEVVNVLSRHTQLLPTPYATHTSRHAPRSTTITSPPHQKHLTHATHHPRHAPVSTEPRDSKEPRGTLPSTTPNARYHLHQEPCTPHTDRNRSTIHAPQHDPLRHAHEHTPPEAPSTSNTSTRAPHPMYVHNPRNAHTEHPFRTYTRHRNHRSSTPPREHTAPSEHHAPTGHKAPSYLTQNTPHPVQAHPKEATTPTSPIPTQVSQRTPLLDPEGQATPGPKPEGLTTTHAQHTAHPKNEDPPPEAQPSRPVAPPPEGRLHETRDPHLQHQEPPASSTATTTGPSTPQAPTINTCYYLHLEPLWLPGEGFEHTARSLRPPGVTPVTVTPVTLHTLTCLSACLSAGMVVDWGRAQS